MSNKYKIRDQHGLNYLTCTICGWVDLFTRAEYRDIVLDSWRYCSEHKGLQIWGYVIMSNHLHMIANTTTPFRLEDTIRDFKAHTARKFIEALQDKKRPESRREWLLYLFGYFAKKFKREQDFQIWEPDNHPIELYSERVVIQKLRYIHDNPVRAKFVNRPQDWIYSSACNYADGQGVYNVHLLWTDFESDGGWFFGNTDFPMMD